MARKQNYSYERFQRQTNKAAKKEAKRETRAARGLLPADGIEGDEGGEGQSEGESTLETVTTNVADTDPDARESD